MDFYAVLRRFGPLALIAATAGLLSGCDEGYNPSVGRAYRPISSATLALMEEKGTSKSAPVLIRTYKKEAELEIWKMKSDGRYGLLKTYPMCRWSGQLGPKVREGDRQVPEGFYAITPAQMNPNSAYYLSFNVGYPNAYDRAHDYTGGSIMVHGVCSSAGCFSMTDEQIADIYAIAREGFSGGQREIQMQSMPFRMTAENFAKYRLDPNMPFWKELKEGTDAFEVSKQEVQVGVCNRHYQFNATAADGSRLDASAPCPPLKHDEDLRAQVAAKEKADNAKIAALVAEGVKPIRTIYADGGQHPDFARVLEVSRPDALAQGPVDIALDDGKARKGTAASPLVQQAAVKARQQQLAEAQRREAEATTKVASAAGESPPNRATAFINNLFSKEPVATSPAIAVSEPSEPQPANVPLPPRRLQTTATKSVISVPMKPEASVTPPKAITGAQAPMPPGFSAYASR